MNVCHAFIWFSIKFTGGTSEFIAKICESQVQSGLIPTVLSGHNHFDEELANSLVGTKFIQTPSYFDDQGFSIMPGLPRVCRENLPDFDVVHLHAFRTFQNAVLFHYCKKLRIPIIVDAHGSVPYGTRKPKLKKIFDRYWGKKILNESAFLVAESEVGVEEYLKIVPDFPTERLKIIYPSFDIKSFEHLPAKGCFKLAHGIFSEDNVVMFVGRLAPIKGLEVLIEGFAKLSVQRKNIKLVFVGDDGGTGYKDILVKLLIKLRLLDKVLFPGFLSGKNKWSAIVDADVVVQSSKQEQGPRVPFEAVLSGTPVVVTGHTGSGELVKEFEAGQTVKYGDADELAQALEWVLSNRKQALNRTHKAAKKIASQMSQTAIAAQYKNLYRMAINEIN